MIAVLMAAAMSAAVRAPGDPAGWNRAMVEVVDIDSLSLSPDGGELLFRTSQQQVEVNRTLLNWHVLDTRSGRVRSLGSAGDAIFDDPGILRAEPPIWLGDGRTAVVRQRGGGATGIWMLRPSASEFARAVTQAADIEAIRLGADGKSILYEVGASREEICLAEEEERDRGVRITPQVDLAQNLFRGGSVEGRQASQRLTGYWFMRSGLLSDAPRQTWRWTPASGTNEPVGKPTAKPAFVAPSIAAAASIAGLNGGRADAFWDGFEGRLEWRVGGKTAIRCAAAMCRQMRVASFAWLVEGQELLVTFTDRYFQQTLASWDLARNRLRPIARGEGLLSGSRRGSAPCATGQNAAYCVEASAAGPPRLVRIDLRTGRTANLFDPNAALRLAYRPSVERLSLRLKDGTPVAGVLLNGGAAHARAPLFINYYRCEGFLRGGEGDEWPIAALIDAGFTIACLNTAPFQGAQDAVETYQNGLASVQALIGGLVGEGRIDPRRVAMGGFSFGSEVTMWTAMKSDLLAAVSIASAQPEPTDYWYGAILGPSHDKVVREVWGLGPPEQTAVRWREISPAFNANKINTPVLLQLPEQEARRIPQLFAALRKAGTPVEFWAYPDEAHIKVEPLHRLAVYERNFDWFTYWLLGARDPAAAKAEQYHRWDEMKEGWRSRKV